MIVMKLNEIPFEQIKNKSKIWEVRLNDEKRQRVQVGDSILFRKLPDLFDGIVCRVVDKKIFNSFSEMASILSLKSLGFEGDCNAKKCEEFYHTLYSVENENKYGVVAFKLEIV